MFCLSDSHISDIRHCFHDCNKDYKSESVNGSSTTCLSFCYIQTDITAVLPPGRGVLHHSIVMGTLPHYYTVNKSLFVRESKRSLSVLLGGDSLDGC